MEHFQENISESSIIGSSPEHSILTAQMLLDAKYDEKIEKFYEETKIVDDLQSNILSTLDVTPSAPVVNSIHYTQAVSLQKNLTLTEKTENETPPQTPIGSKHSYICENAWDSSPSTVAFDEEEPQAQFNTHVQNIGERDRDYQAHSGYIEDDENDSDIELIQRSRQIQLDLRLREMSELAIEAERAAAAGEDSFKGNATRFDLGLGLDVDVLLPPPSSINMIPIRRRKHPQEIKSKGRLWNVECDSLYCNDRSKVNDPPSPTEQWVHPTESSSSTAAMRQKNILKSSTLEFSSARKLAHTSSVSSMTSHFPHVINSRRFLVTPAQEVDKIPVLNLRHINDVIPSFRDMQSFIMMHLSRSGSSVVYSTPEIEKNESSTSRNFSHHISGFQQILRSFSSNSYKQRELTIVDDQILKTEVISFESNDGNESCTSSEIQDCTRHILYVDALASESYDPKMNLRTSSPLPLSPYENHQNDDNIVVHVRAPSSAWTNFWVNMSAVKTSNVEASPSRHRSFTDNFPSKPFLLTPIARRKSQPDSSLLLQDEFVSLEPYSNYYDDIEVQEGDLGNDEVKLTVNAATDLLRRDGSSYSSTIVHSATSSSLSQIQDKKCEAQNLEDTLIQNHLHLTMESSVNQTVRNDQQSVICSQEEKNVKVGETIIPSASNGPSESDTEYQETFQISLQTLHDTTEGIGKIETSDKIDKESKGKEVNHIYESKRTPITRSLSFLNLMVEKVPSVIGGFNPLRKAKRNTTSYHDDISFIENYLYTGIKQRNRDSLKRNIQKTKNPKVFCGVRVNCFDVGCDSMLDTLHCFNEKNNDQYSKIQSNDSLVEPTSKFASIQRVDRPRKILFENKMFQPPLLNAHQYKDKLTDISEDDEVSVFDE